MRWCRITMMIVAAEVSVFLLPNITMTIAIIIQAIPILRLTVADYRKCSPT